MKPNAVQMALARRDWGRFNGGLAGLFMAALLLIAPALAGDRAGIGFLGYSPDGRYFAFDEFGLQDGSGFAYANVYVLDLQTDKWVKDTPVRVRLDDDASTIVAARAKAHGQAQKVLDALAIGAPVDIMALNGDGALGDSQTLAFGRPGYGMAPPAQSHQLSLSTVDAPLGEPQCAQWSAAEVKGFALTLTTEGSSREVYRDQSVPKSRGCPQGYRLYGVIAPFDAIGGFTPNSLTGLVAIISVYVTGFEGPDRRFIAVPLGL